MNQTCGMPHEDEGEVRVCGKPAVEHVDVPCGQEPSGYLRIYLCAEHYDKYEWAIDKQRKFNG